MSDKYEALRAAKSRAEDVQAGFGGVKAVLGAVDDYIYHQFITVELESWPQEHVNYHAKSLQELLCVMTHLLADMEKEQDELVHVLSGRAEGSI